MLSDKNYILSAVRKENLTLSTLHGVRQAMVRDEVLGKEFGEDNLSYCWANGRESV